MRNLKKIIRRAAAHPIWVWAADLIVRRMSQKLVGTYPNPTALNERFREYDLALLNVKTLGYELGRRMAKERLSRNIAAPPPVALRSKLCTQEDIESDWFVFWCHEIKSAPIYHRKLWELSYIAQALWHDGKLAPGKSGIAFGCGEEPLPSVFAKYGASVLATDLPADRSEAEGWRATGQHSSQVDGLRRTYICPDERLLANINFRPVDMNDIPDDLNGRFDFCWSTCALEHLGSVAKGLDFIEKSLRTLRPGGIAIHTTEFSLDPEANIDNCGTVIFRPDHFLSLADRVTRQGYIVGEQDFSPGTGILDAFVDVPPWVNNQDAHLKLSVGGFPCTSYGIIIKARP